MNSSLAELLRTGDAFQGYAYAYPHKTAYRRLEPAIPLLDAWDREDKSALFLYAHIPFCEMRCGFCNLFTTTHPSGGLISNYLDALERQAEAVSTALGPKHGIARLALGGGTPTFLQLRELERLFTILKSFFPGVDKPVPKAVEASPATVDSEKLDWFMAQGVTRVSLGVQSFIEQEVRALGRTQKNHAVHRALALMSGRGFRCINIDLIYGIARQTKATWLASLEQALEFAPQEIYLYPLYVRPLTGLDRSGCAAGDNRLVLYREGREFLLERGYRQISMRLFRSDKYRPLEGPVYCCQEDGMVGLGAGARSYTSALHYSNEYAVGRVGIRAILDDFVSRSAEQFAHADYGCRLDLGEQKRRYVLKSLLRVDGLDLNAYQSHFGSDAFDDLPQLRELENLSCEMNSHLRLSAEGLELSDVIGPWLCSPIMRDRMHDFALS